MILQVGSLIEVLMPRRAPCCIAALCFLLVPACSKQTDAPSGKSVALAPAEIDKHAPYFEALGPESGVNFTYRNGEEAGHLTLLESLGGGVALIDYDGDGLLDIFLTGGGYFDGPDKKEIKGHPCKLYRNLGGWRFEDVTTKAGLDRLAHGEPWFYSHGAAVADYDNDGWPDLLVTGYGRLALFHNVPDGKGGRKFVEVTKQAGLTDTLWSTSAAWGDVDGDGFVDLYVTHYVDWSFQNHPRCPGYVPTKSVDICSPRPFKALPDTLYVNNGNGTFRDASQEAGLRRDGKGLGVLMADLDGDGKLDIYVANDTTESFLYVNQGAGRFTESGLIRGVAYGNKATPQGSMGVDAADYDGSGNFSLFVANFQLEPHALYRNLGQGQFQCVSEPAGIAAIGLSYVGFGTGFLDFDRDGAEDLFIANGHITHDPAPPSEYKQRPVLFRNLRNTTSSPGGVRFRDVSQYGGAYFQEKHVGRGVAFGDLDNDGRTDIVISHANAPVVLLRNKVDNGHHWLGIRLVGRPNGDAIGAMLTLEVGGQKLARQVKGGGSYLSSNDRRIIFGLGPTSEVGRLTVRWPSGATQIWDQLACDRYWELTEGK